MHWIDPAHLPATRGTVERYLVNPEGRVDGFLLSSGMEVHVPPHLERAVKKHATIGAKVVIRGIRPRDVEMIAAVAFGGPDGMAVTDEGPGEEKPAPPKPAAAGRAEGEIVRHLHGPKGEVRGALLDDDTLLRWKKHHAIDHAVGSRVVAEGPLRRSTVGRVLDVHAIGASEDDLADLPHEPKHKGPRPPKRRR